MNWPHQHDPRRSAIYARNDVDVKAPPEMVWKLLIDAHNWSKFYPHAQDLKIVTGERVLGLRAKYSWKTADIPLVNTVQEFVPGERISWDSFLAEGHEDSSAYHGWIITPTDGGCHLLTEETQRGPFFVEELARKHPGTLYQFHQDWVETLARYVSQFPRENHHLKVLRAFQDGPYVFTQEEGLILGQSVFFDIFRFEDGLIVEHCFFDRGSPSQRKRSHSDRRAN